MCWRLVHILTALGTWECSPGVLFGIRKVSQGTKMLHACHRLSLLSWYCSRVCVLLFPEKHGRPWKELLGPHFRGIERCVARSPICRWTPLIPMKTLAAFSKDGEILLQRRNSSCHCAGCSTRWRAAQRRQCTLNDGSDHPDPKYVSAIVDQFCRFATSTKFWGRYIFLSHSIYRMWVKSKW